MNILWNESMLELFDYPLDYEIVEEGCFYHDPSIPDGQPTWLYSTVPVDYKFPKVEYEIIEECFIPDESSELNLKKGQAYIDLLSDIEYEAMLLTNTLSEEERAGGVEEYRKGKVNPQGYIKVYNNQKKVLEGVRKIKVRVQRGVKISSAYTQISGFYIIPKKYKNNVRYSLIFTNEEGFKIWGNFASVSPATYNLGWHYKGRAVKF